jgi:tetratricopeptide (TPR) repeat protein
VESGEADAVRQEASDMLKKNPNDPSIIYLDAVLTADAQEALDKFFKVVDYYATSKYADAALYRIYSYYFAVGLYETAQKNLDRLKQSYPNSPYIRYAEKKVADGDAAEFHTAGNQNTFVTKGNNYSIQAGAFTSEDNASNLSKDLKKAGYKVSTHEKEIAGTVFTVVMVGDYKTAEEAEKDMKAINKSFNLNGRVIFTGN